MLERCESSWERTTFALEVRLDELREQQWCSSHTQSNPLQSYSFFLLSSTGPNGYPIPGHYAILFPIPNLVQFWKSFGIRWPKISCIPDILGIPNISGAGNLQRLIGWFGWLLARQNLFGTLLEKSKSKSFDIIWSKTFNITHQLYLYPGALE